MFKALNDLSSDSALLFDYGGVCQTFCFGAFIRSISDRVRISEQTIRKRYRDLQSTFLHGKLTSQEALARLAGRTFGAQKAKNIFNQVLATEATDRNIRLIDWIDKQQSSYTSIDVASNVIPPHRQYLSQNGCYCPFNKRWLSCKLGTDKSKQAFFEAVEKHYSDSPRNKLVLIDDSEQYVSMAEDRGWRGIQYEFSTGN